MTIITGEQARNEIRTGNLKSPTPGIAYGYTQANLVVLPYKYAIDFFIFCQRNPKPCPILDVCEPGKFTPVLTAPSADIRTDIPKYRIYRNGEIKEEVNDILNLWSDDLVTFLLGCSFTFEKALSDAGIDIRHIEEEKNVPMYITNIECIPAGIFNGPMVVSMRPIPEELVKKATEITSKYPRVHGAPIHTGNPLKIGIKDISKPDFGDAVTIKKGEVPVFWACGVTPQAAVMRVKPELVITHAPGYMFISDIKDDDLVFY
ncbi:putative hydro-lyase [Clostridium lundense]|uniref:putative hydro-lyase n=1 Tax=Clostridium lundense TaxID=319475 RepID=UPI000488777F|nr:putative hydro-lyase [Clostridium lundense]